MDGNRLKMKIRDTISGNGLSKIPGVMYLDELLFNIDLPSDPIKITYQGYDLWVIPDRTSIESSLYLYGSYEKHIRKTITNVLDPGDVAMDIGALVGHHSLSMLDSVGESGEVLMFEPAPGRAKVLQKTAEMYKNLHLFEMGIASDNDEPAYNPELDAPSGISNEDTVESDMLFVTLDDFVEENEVGQIDLIKMDIEGFEIGAINGFDKHIDKVHKLIIEVHKENIQNWYEPAEIETAFDILSQFDTFSCLDDDISDIDKVEEILEKNGRPQFIFERNCI